MSAILAFAGQSVIEKYGAYAGIAAIPGLAVLSLLYFAQAREVRRLREWAGSGPERDLEVARAAAPPATAAARAPVARPSPARAAAVARPGAGPPRSATGAVRPAAAAAAGAAAASRPAHGQQEGPGAAPAKVEGPAEERPAAPATADGPGEDDSVAPAVPAAATAAAQGAAGRADEGAQDDGQVQREPALSGAAATALREREAAHDSATAPAQPNRQGTAVAPADQSRPGSGPPRQPSTGPSAPVRPASAGRPAARAGAGAPPTRSAARRPGGSGRSRGRRPIVLLAVGAVVLLVGVVIAVTQLGGGSKDTTAPPNTIQGQPAQSGTSTKKAAKGAPVNRGDVTVAVLNGTTAPGLAQTVLDQVVASGFQDGGADTNADQQVQRTTVYFGPGQQAAAKDVAKQLKVSGVRRLDAGTQAIAGADAGVVVVVGADRTP